MHCYNCGGTYLEKSDLFEFDDPYVGTISVQGISYFKCDTCDDVLFTIEMTKALENAINARKKELLNQFPISAFLSASDTASFLGISRQALHKNRRIRHGFIHQTMFGGSIVYLKKSVIQFKETGDGRFSLYPSVQDIPVKYMRSITLIDMTDIHSFNFPLIAGLHTEPYLETTLTRLEKNSYAK